MGQDSKLNLQSLRDLQRKDPISNVESFLYSEVLSSVMVADVFTSLEDTVTLKLIKEMAEREISSVVVVNAAGEPVGILTERDIMKLVAREDVDLSRVAISEVMTRNPYFLHPDDNIFRAMSLLAQKGIKHLPLVRDEKIAGIVTLRHLLKIRHPEPSILLNDILEADNISDLKYIKEEMGTLAASKFDGGVRSTDIVIMLSLVNQEIHRRTFELVLKDLGTPPVDCCLFLTGSHGRLENLFTTDQDHALIIADSEDELQYEQYFIDISRTFSEHLQEIGYAFCPGYVMCMNPTWRKSLTEWKTQLWYWFNAQVTNLTRFVTVFFDSVPIYGRYKLFNELFDYAYQLLGTHNEVLRMLHDEEGSHRVPTSLLGRFVTEKSGEHKGQMDIKRSGLIFMVEAIRILALRYGIRETATLRRIEQLVVRRHLNPDDGEYYEAAYKFLLRLALGSQLEKLKQGRVPDTYISPDALSQRERELLRHSFKAVTSLQETIASEFGELVI